jgi:hypothetical protein
MPTAARIEEWKEQDLADMQAAGYNPELIPAEEFDAVMFLAAFRAVCKEDELVEQWSTR